MSFIFFVNNFENTYTINPAAIPSGIEYPTIIIIIVTNPAEAAVKSCQSMLESWVAISIPTQIREGAITGSKNIPPTSIGEAIATRGVNIEAIKNQIPVVIAVNPVLPPAATPLVDSVKVVTVEVPNTAPTSG